MDENILKNAEIGGFSAVFLICAYGIYKILLVKGFSSRCGIFQLDLKTPQTRQKEIEYRHIEEMAKIQNRKLELELELQNKINHTNNIIDDYNKTNPSNSSEEVTRQ